MDEWLSMRVKVKRKSTESGSDLLDFNLAPLMDDDYFLIAISPYEVVD